jgi:outer membrane protein assembly factor BamB
MSTATASATPKGARWGVAAVLAALCAGPALGSDWPQWRGPDGNGVSPEAGLVSSWSRTGDNVVFRLDWTGRSTPVVFDGRVCASGRADLRYEVIGCWDAKDGRALWQRRFLEYNTTIPFSRVGWASVSGDPETGYLYAQNGDGLLSCFDRDGKTVWEWRLGEEMGRSSGYGGRTHTPLIDEDRVITSIVGTGWGDQAALRQRYVAFDKRTGKVLWMATPNTIPVEDFNNQSNAAIAVIGGQRLMIGGGADGFIYALKVRTGETAWRFKFSTKSLNSAPTVAGNTVYASQSEEPVDGNFMGQVIALDGSGHGDLGPSAVLWHTDGILAGFAAPLYHDGRLYVVDNAANLHALDAKTGQDLFKYTLGTIGRGSPVFADGKIFASEVNGNLHIVKPGAEKVEVLDHDHLTMPDGRHVEIWGSFAVAYGRVYFLAEDGLYCLGDKKAPFKGPAPGSSKAAGGKAPGPAEPPAPAGAVAAGLQVVPAEVVAKAGEEVAFEVRAFDDKGRALPATSAKGATFSLEGLAGTITPEGRFKADPAKGNQGGKVKATLGALSATARVRAFAPLPWSEDFEGGKVPGFWVGAGRLAIAEGDGGKTLHKAPVQTGLNRATVFIGPSTMSGYTIEIDLRATKKGRKMPDFGLINGGYTLDLMGNHQKLQIRSWASELAYSQDLAFPWEADVWYRMKLRVDVEAGQSVAHGKVWKKAEPEPADWTITYADKGRITSGAPGIYGDSSVDIDYDNLTVVVNK